MGYYDALYEFRRAADTEVRDALRIMLDGYNLTHDEIEDKIDAYLALGYYPEHIDFFLALCDKKIVGLLPYSFTPDNISILTHPVVAKDCRQTEKVQLDLIAEHGVFAREKGIGFLQAVFVDPNDAQIPLFGKTGFEFLSRLEYLETVCSSAPAVEFPDDYRLDAYSAENRAEFAQIVKSTYVDSLDCTALHNDAPPEEIISGYKSRGVFAPEFWFVLKKNAAPAGLIVANRSESPNNYILVYIGIAAEHRGRGLGKRMVGFLKNKIGNNRTLALDVDSENRYAKALYAECGFRKIQSKHVYIKKLGSGR